MASALKMSHELPSALTAKASDTGNVGRVRALVLLNLQVRGER